MKRLLVFFLLLFFACPVEAHFCYQDAELESGLTPAFLADDDFYHHTSQGMCVADDILIYTRFQSDSVPTTYVLIDLETKKEIAHYDLPTQHSNSLTYNPDTHEVVAVSNGHAYVMLLDGDVLTLEEDITLSHNCPKIAYCEEEKVYYLGNGVEIFKSEDLSEMTRCFPVEHPAINQGMGFDGEYLYIIWYRESNNEVHVYDLSGKLIRKMTLISPTYREIEDIDFYQGKMLVNIANSPDRNGVYEVSPVHIFSKWKVDRKPTCAKKGARHRICKSCKMTLKEVLPPTGKHQSGKWEVTKKPACEKEGERIRKCKVCGKITHKEVLKALGHDLSEWQTVKEPTVLEEGEEKRECSRCDLVETNTLSRLPATIHVNVKSLPVQRKHSTSVINVKLNTGDYVDKWTSSDESIATVDHDGTVHGLKRGRTEIHVKSKGGAYETIKIHVSWLPVWTKDLSVTCDHLLEGRLSLKEGSFEQLSVKKYPLSSTSKVSFKSSNKKVAVVSEKGMIQAVGKGETTITVRSWLSRKKINIKVY